MTVLGMTRPVEGRHGEPPRGFRLRQGYAGQDGGQVCARRPILFAVPSASLALQASPATPAPLPSPFCKLLTIPIRRVHQVPFIPHLPLFIPRFPPSFPQVPPFWVHEIRLRMGPRERNRNRHSREARVERRGRRMSSGGCIALPPASTLAFRLSVVAPSSPFSGRRPVEGAFLRILVSLPRFAKRRLEYQEYQDCQEYQEYQEDRDCPYYPAGAAGGAAGKFLASLRAEASTATPLPQNAYAPAGGSVKSYRCAHAKAPGQSPLPGRSAGNILTAVPHD